MRRRHTVSKASNSFTTARQGSSFAPVRGREGEVLKLSDRYYLRRWNSLHRIGAYAGEYVMQRQDKARRRARIRRGLLKVGLVAAALTAIAGVYLTINSLL